MKHLTSYFSLLILSFLMIACGTKSNEQTLGEQLQQRLEALAQQGIMVGHQDDPFYGVHWQWEEGRSDVLESVDDYPAVMGFDLGGIEMGDEKNLDSVPFTRIHDELIAHHERGGIVTLSWHPRNPVTGGNAWDTSDSTVVRNVLPGGKEYEKFIERHKAHDLPFADLRTVTGDAYLGIDAGSTTTKLVLITEKGELLYQYYAANRGQPLDRASHGSTMGLAEDADADVPSKG